MDIAALDAYLSRIDLTSSRTEVLAMRDAAPARQVGVNALNNVIAKFASEKNGFSVMLESHTVEREFAYELEFDEDVLSYVCQVPCTRIESTNRDGRRRVNSATVDFMVFRSQRIELVECKAKSTLAQLAARDSHDYVAVDQAYTRPAYERWARERGLHFRVWHPPERGGTRLQNLAFLYALRHEVEPEASIVGRISEALAAGPLLVDEIVDSVPGANALAVAQMLAKRQIFGPVDVIRLDEPWRFRVGLSEKQAQLETQALLAASGRDRVLQDDRLLTARKSEIDVAIARLKEVSAFENGRLPYSKRLARLAKDVRTAREQGSDPLLACLPKFATRGNRLPRVTSAVLEIVESTLRSAWDRGGVQFIQHAYFEIQAKCEASGLEAPSRSYVYKKVKARNRTSRDLATGGKRTYHKNRAASDPRDRAGTSLARGQSLHIDSTLGDIRTLQPIFGDLVMGRPTIYVGIDGATDEVMAMAIGFGNASRDALAYLVRDYVRQHGFLPDSIWSDRGCENTSDWFSDFLDTRGIHGFWYPTGGSRYAGRLENQHGLLTSLVLKHLPGNTHPDKAGRAVDGKFKSLRTARLEFAAVRQAVEEFLREALPQMPRRDGYSPIDRRTGPAGALAVGRPCQLDELLMFETSIPSSAKTYNRIQGIRLAEASYTSEELKKFRNILKEGFQVRRDPENSAIVRVLHELGITKAYSAGIQSTQTMELWESAFDYQWSHKLRAESAEVSKVLARGRFERIKGLAKETRQRFVVPPAPQAEPDPVEAPLVVSEAWDMGVIDDLEAAP